MKATCANMWFEIDVPSLCWQFFVLWRGWWPCPWVLWRDSGDEKWQKKVQVEENSEKSYSTGELGRRVRMFCHDYYHWKWRIPGFFFLSGNCEARPPVYSCRFPHCPLWGVTLHRTDLLWGAATQVPFFWWTLCSSPEHWHRDRTCGLQRPENIQNKMLYFWISLWSKSALFTEIHNIDVHKSSDSTGCVSSTQLICKQSQRIHHSKVYSFVILFAGKTCLDVKRL